ncbi:hypothetical protein MTR_1g068865 [Medicago truncatula]|uniref:Uncharacterized protein n=1 Tax=Medicago truncatula TaxID=3880 RepID=A0A072VLV8_MEDTR|nr:hypothetical protein MTR_1g068865 [Medicago truncatula]
MTKSIIRNNLLQLRIKGSSFTPLQFQFKSLGQEVIPIRKIHASHRSKFLHNNVFILKYIDTTTRLNSLNISK